MYKILLVEDDKSLSVGLVYYLNKEGYHITHTETVHESLDIIQKEKFDIALLDVTLPDGEGYELVKPLKKQKDTPIIFLTAKDEETDILKGFSIGADDYITKPFSLKVLNARIKNIIDRSNEEKDLKRYSGDLVVDVQAVKVYKNGKPLDLTQTEFKLLVYFIDNYNIAISREKLLEFLWDSDAEFQAYSTISVYINRLREKIEDGEATREYIMTKRGIGYMWVMEVK